MLAIKAQFDGEKVILPEEARGAPPGEVVVIFQNGGGDRRYSDPWIKAQEATFAKAWDNDEDAIYDVRPI